MNWGISCILMVCFTLSSLHVHVQSSDLDEEQSNTNDDDADDSGGNWLPVSEDKDSESEFVRKYDEYTNKIAKLKKQIKTK